MSSVLKVNCDNNLLFKDCRIDFGKKLLVQKLHRAGYVVFVDHKADVNLRCALGDHAYVDICDRAEHLAGDSWRFAYIFAHQADDGFAPRIFHVGQLLQIGGDGRDGLIGINGKRDADLRGGDHIHGAAMAVKDLEDGAQKAMRHQHARSYQVHDGNTFLDRDGLDRVAAMGSARGDACPFVFGVARVEHVHRNILLDSRQHGCRVQHLGAKVSQLSGLVKTDLLDAACLGAETRVGGHHAVHVGPDFDA